MDSSSTTIAQGNGSEARNTGTNLFVTGIHPRLTEDDVTRLFSKYGEVEKCQIMVDPHTKESRGFGFVKMATLEQADAAKDGLQGEEFEGRVLSIEKARRNRPRTPTPGKYFGPPKRGNITIPIFLRVVTNFNRQMTSVVFLHVIHPMKIVAMEGVLMVLVVMMMTDTLLVMMTAGTAITVPVIPGMITGPHLPVVLTVMLVQAERIGIHPVEKTAAIIMTGMVAEMVATRLGAPAALQLMIGLHFLLQVGNITGTTAGATVKPTPGDRLQKLYGHAFALHSFLSCFSTTAMFLGCDETIGVCALHLLLRYQQPS